MDYAEFHNSLKDIKKNINPPMNLEKGISVVIPIYDGLDYIEACLDSLSNQKIKNAKFEVILVFNGCFIEEYNYMLQNEFDDLDIILLINDISSAGAARNLGMKSAKYSHITFIDVDDYVSQNYIQSNYDAMDENTITFSQINDVIDDEIFADNSLNKEVIDNDGLNSVSLLNLNRIASITVCKVIPKEIILLQKFRDYLRSGEDTVFYSELFVNSRPRLKVVPIEEEAIYYRRIRENSVSRKTSSFDFLVFQRLEILEILQFILDKIHNPTLIKFVKSKYNAQISFMNKYLIENPQDRNKVLNAIDSMMLDNFNYSILNRELANTLVLSYCFPPFSDTSATIVTKRIINKNEVVDVVSNNMNRIRHKEPSLNKMVKPLVGKKLIVNQTASFSSMYYLSEYIDEAVRFYIKNEENYSKFYSRAMFPISHIPGLFIKIINPDIKWIAEFSDPLLYNIESTERQSSMKNDVLLWSLENGLLGMFSKYVDDNLFNLSELIPFALADELVFTNENQLEFMISRFNDEEKKFIRNKATVSHHPTLSSEYYHIDNAQVEVEESIVNIAYFGNFYSRRGYNQFVSLVNNLNEKFKLTFKLHVYTNLNQLEESSIIELHQNNVSIHEYLPFTEFLNASTKFDILLISDANTKEDKPVNPYLPSKLSDYLGSGRPILAITEDTSVMSKMVNESLYKVDMTEFDNMISNNTIHEHIEIIRLIRYLDEKDKIYKKRKLEVINNKLLLSDDNSLMEVSGDLGLINVDKQDWLVRPKQLPINLQKNYTITLYNHSDNIKEFEIMSYYSVPRVITVEIIDKNNNLVKTKCISDFRNKMNRFEIMPNSKIEIALIYRKEYDKVGFLDAGRLRIKGI